MLIYIVKIYGDESNEILKSATTKKEVEKKELFTSGILAYVQC